MAEKPLKPGDHPKKQHKKLLRQAEKEGWRIVKLGSGHAWGQLRCSYGCCDVSVNSTPKNPDNDVKRLRKRMNRCPKGTKVSE